MSPSLDDHEGRLHTLEGIAAENRWRIVALERSVEKTVDLLDRVERHVERAEWKAENTAAALTKRHAVMLSVGIAVVAPSVSIVLAHFLR